MPDAIPLNPVVLYLANEFDLLGLVEFTIYNVVSRLQLLMVRYILVSNLLCSLASIASCSGLMLEAVCR